MNSRRGWFRIAMLVVLLGGVAALYFSPLRNYLKTSVTKLDGSAGCATSDPSDLTESFVRDAGLRLRRRWDRSPLRAFCCGLLRSWNLE